MELPKKEKISTHSYDAHLVNVNYVLAGNTLWMRRGCNGVIMTISEKKSGWIYVTNIEDFGADRDKKITALMRGMQFQTVPHKGWIFTSHKYIKGSLKPGGYSSYPLK